MNLRLGSFGRQESASAVLLASFVSGCFAIDPQALFQNGNRAYFVQGIATVLALLLFELLTAAIHRRGGNDLYALIGGSRGKAALSVPLVLALLLGAMQPMEQFLSAITQYVFVETKQTVICLYLLPCLTLLTVLGAETLVRAARLLLPMLLVSVLVTLALVASQARLYRLYPIPLSDPLSWCEQLSGALFRAFLPLLALLCVGEGTQTPKALKTAGRIGGLCGGVLCAAALFGLSATFTYSQLYRMPAPFYRMLIEVRAENPTLRLDRATFFLWMSGAVLVSAFYLYAACVLFAKTFGVRDVRPLAFSMCALSVTLILVLYYDSEPTQTVLKTLYRDAWILLAVSIPFLFIRTRKERTVCGAAS